MGRGNKGFTNKAKSGAKATTERWRQAVERARVERRAKDESAKQRAPKKKRDSD